MEKNDLQFADKYDFFQRLRIQISKNLENDFFWQYSKVWIFHD